MAKAEPLLGTRAALLHLSRNLKAIAEKIDRLEIVRATSIGLMLRASSKAEMQRLARVQLISSSDTNDTIPRLMTIRQFHMLRMLSGILPKRGVHMRAHLMLVLSAAVIIAMVCATAPLLKVTLNEEGTDVVAVDFSDIVAPKAAVAAEPR